MGLVLVAGISAALTALLGLLATAPLRRLSSFSRELVDTRTDTRSRPRHTLRGEIGEICSSLRELVAAQKQESESFVSFSSDIVHELKTPLAAIRSGLEIYSESIDEPERAEVYGRINQRIQQMDRLMGEIQAIGRIESDAAVESSANLAALAELILREFDEYEVSLSVSPEVARCEVPIGPDRMRQLVGNLVRNAVSFSPEPGSVSVSLFVAGRYLMVQVSDKGPGIPDEVMHQIAGRFFSYRPGTRGNHSGLGLAIVTAILRRCGGYLRYRNLPTQGAEFACKIPVHQRANDR